MPRSTECRRLLKAMYPETVYARLILAKCAAGLAVIALIAVAGLNSPVNVAARSPQTAAIAAAEGVRAIRAEPHRKRVFDERRARFEGGAGRRSIASEGVEPANRLPLALR